ncbi:hypothetical protein D9M69_458450 [compost metagenome]
MDRWKVMKSELMYWFCCATSAPAMPQVTAATTKAMTLARYTRTPTDDEAISSA